MKNTFKLSGRIAALLVASSAVLVAQGQQQGNLGGTVKTVSGQPIANALITVFAGQGERTTRTDANGSFRFLVLNSQANIKVTVSAPGYIGATVTSSVNIGKTNLVEVALRPITQTGATVEVVAARDVVNTTEAAVQTNASLAEINALPINNRTITSIASLSPGTSADANGLTIRGSMATQVQFLVDGADVMDPVTGGPSVRMNEEMLEEVQVISGAASAEYGRFTGGVVNTMPWFGGLLVFFAMANAGLPGTSGFVGEFMVILGAIQINFWYAFLAAFTLIFGAAYTLWMVKRVFYGAVANDQVAALSDLNKREFFILATLAVLVLALGVYPQAVTDMTNATVNELLTHFAQSKLPASLPAGL